MKCDIIAYIQKQLFLSYTARTIWKEKSLLWLKSVLTFCKGSWFQNMKTCISNVCFFKKQKAQTAPEPELLLICIEWNIWQSKIFVFTFSLSETQNQIPSCFRRIGLLALAKIAMTISQNMVRATKYSYILITKFEIWYPQVKTLFVYSYSFCCFSSNTYIYDLPILQFVQCKM